MRDARFLLMLAGAYITLAACGRDDQAEENQVITDINAADPGDIEAVPPDESVDQLPAENAASGEEIGDGDEMVNITDTNQG